MKSHIDFEIIFDTAPHGKGIAVRKGLQIASGKIISIIDADAEYTINNLIEIALYRNLSSFKLL